MPAKCLIDEVKKAAIIAAYAANCSFPEMEKRFDISSPVLRKYLRVWGVYRSKTRHGVRRLDATTFDEEEIAIILEMYKRGCSTPKIGRCIGVRPITISAFLKTKGVFQARRNKDYKLGVTDEQIKKVFAETGSIRTTARQLGGINTRFIKAALIRLEVKDPTHHEVYARAEERKDEIIALYQQHDISMLDIYVKFDISKHILREILKKWGAYNVKKRPNLRLVKAGLSKATIIDTYNQLRIVSVTAENLGLSEMMVSKVLKDAKIGNYFSEKSDLIEKDKDAIIHRYNVIHEPCKKIAVEYGVWSTTILDALKRWGIKPVNHKNKAIQDKLEANKVRICDLYENKAYALREIADEVGVGHGALIRVVKRWGLVVPDNRYKESSLERKFKKMLVAQGIAFTQFKQVVNRIYDFHLPEFNLIVECNGDYWHGNPRVFATLDEGQIKGHQRDIHKNALARKAGYAIYFIWESEIVKTPDLVVSLLRKLIAGEAPIDQCSPMDFLTERPELMSPRMVVKPDLDIPSHSR